MKITHDLATPIVTEAKPSVFINGWTKESVIQHMRDNWKGRAVVMNPLGVENCQYLTPDGRKCAVGMFVVGVIDAPDTNSAHMLLKHPEQRQYMPLKELELRKLQSIHDTPGVTDHQALANLIAYVEGLT